MIMEIAQIEITPGMEKEFEAGVKKAAPIFKRAKGCSAMMLTRSHEHPQRYRLFVRWATVENHTVDFRGSADFQEWRKLVGHCFAGPPAVEHVTEESRAASESRPPMRPSFARDRCARPSPARRRPFRRAAAASRSAVATAGRPFAA